LLDRFLAEDNLRRFYIAQVMLYGGTFIVISACVCCDSMEERIRILSKAKDRRRERRSMTDGAENSRRSSEAVEPGLLKISNEVEHD